MSQEYTEDKNVKLTRLSSSQRIFEALLILITLFAIWLIAALVSFDPSDPSWSQTAWHEPIHNLGGRPGAWLADTLLFIFGIMAYTIPVIIIGGCWFAWRHQASENYVDYFSVALRLIGVLALMLTSCGLAAMNADDIWYFASGGVIGSLLSTTMMPLLTSSGGTIALLCVWAAGLTLFTGWSWVSIAEKIGAAVLNVLTFASNHTRRDGTWQEDDDEGYDDDNHTASRRARILRGALARKQHIAENVINPVSSLKTDDALFSGRRMDDDTDDILFSARGVNAGDDDDARLPCHDTLFPDTDSLFNAHSAAAPVSASVIVEADTALNVAAPMENGNRTVPHAATLPSDLQTISPEWQHMPDDRAPVSTLSPIADNHDSLTRPYLSPNAAVSMQDNLPPAPQESGRPSFYSEVSAAPTLPEEEYRSGYQGPQREAMSIDDVSSLPDSKASRPPLWHVEEVETQRAREREQLAVRYQAIPNIDDLQTLRSDSVTISSLMAPQPESITDGPSGITAAASGPGAASHAAPAFTPAFSPAGDAPRSQVKEGLGPQLPRPNRVRVPTRRELASYGIKLPSQRMAEEKARAARQQTEQYAASMSEDEVDAQQMDELARRFAVQQQRDGTSMDEESRQHDAESEAFAVEQAELARQFAALQQARYASSDPAPVINSGPEDNDYQGGKLTQPSASGPQFMPEPLKDKPLQWEAQPNKIPADTWRAASGCGYQAAQQSVVTSPLSHVVPPTDVHDTAPGYDYQMAAQQQPDVTPPGESLIHPLLMRNGIDRQMPKPTTPLPSLDLLASPPAEVEPIDNVALQQMARLVEARLADFRIKADVVNYSPGPVITRFELNLAPGVKAARISNLSRDLARSLSTVAVRVVEVIPGKPYVGLELPNKKRQTVFLREVLDCPAFRDSASPLSVVLGKDIAGEPVVTDLAKMPHLLVAGTTGSGKSVGVNAMILSMLFKATPEEVRFIMIDPKMLELSVYEGIPHLLTEVVTDMKDAANALRWSVNEMERRYKLMSALGVRNLAGYNEKILQAEHMGRPIPDPYWKPGDSMDATHPVLQKLPYIVVLVDEFADLMMSVGKKVEELIARLAQKARASGIHLVLATQRPSVDVITGLIKANIPTRIAFTVSSKIDSRTILDQGGAESLLGMGDMLYSGPNSTLPVRVHGAFVRDEEVHAVVQDWKARGRPQYVEGITSDNESEGGGAFDSGEELDALFDQAVAFVVEKRKASISGVQRQFRIGYNRAARIIEQMEAQGIVSGQGHNGNREVLAPPSFE